jgi:hypothetical protein
VVGSLNRGFPFSNQQALLLRGEESGVKDLFMPHPDFSIYRYYYMPKRKVEKKGVNVMATILINKLENEIDNTLELSSICRGEWCRALEAKVDALEDEVIEAGKTGIPVEGARIAEMSHKIMKAYKNLGPDFRL